MENEEKINPNSEVNSALVVQHFLNHKWYVDLDKFLKDIEWDVFGGELLEPKKVRKFAKGIDDEEVRLDVMKFLKTYAKQYFLDAAEDKVYNDKLANMHNFIQEKEKTADQYIQLFQQELLFLIDQLEHSGQFSGDHVAKLNIHIAALEKESNGLKEEKQKLQKEIAALKLRIDELEHPERKHQISNELQCEEFYHIITYLANKGVVTPKQATDSFYVAVSCYHWNKSKVLFGYFVCKICYLLELRTKDDHLIWKPFKLAFDNFDKLEKQARDHASKNRNWENSSFSTKPDDAYIIDEALEYSANKMEKSKASK